MTTGSDFVARFLFEALDIRGAFARLGDVWRSLLAGRGYDDAVRDLLGELTATAVLIGDNLKQPGRLTFQLQGSGPVRLLVVDCTAALRLRGMAEAAPGLAPAPLRALLGDGRLSLILQNDAAREPWQSLVPLAGDSIAAVFEHYLAQSEQQPARLWLAADGQSACGLFLQKLPGADARDADGWARVCGLAATASAAEMRELAPADLLGRLFAEEDVRLYAPKPVAYDCPEDAEKVRAMLRALGRREVESILAEQGEVVVRDEMCNREYRFGAGDLGTLFPPVPAAARTLH
ncbi:MAG TPA: Hsp33 family molecular chaperone HslO [Candidatus Desulfobacillus sp.]|nr:Hsp33 family molecular chaperone HslO [Candidatus Desulfobacillus sp.]